MANLALNMSILKAVPLFARFSDHELAALSPAIQHRNYPRHSFMLRARERTDALYILLSGRAKVLLDDDRGREVTLSIIGPSEYFGEMSLIDSKARSASVQALEPCEVLYISKNAFMACLENNFKLAMVLLSNVIGHLREADQKIAGLALMDVQGRLARLLIDHATERHGRWIVETGTEEMARMVGASREMVSRVIRGMVEAGLVRREKRMIIVLDRAAMNQRGAMRRLGFAAHGGPFPLGS